MRSRFPSLFIPIALVLTIFLIRSLHLAVISNLGNLFLIQWSFDPVVESAENKLHLAARLSEISGQSRYDLTGRARRAVDLWQRMSSDPALLTKSQAEEAFTGGKILLEGGDSIGALSSFRQACNLTPHFIEACFRYYRLSAQLELLGEKQNLQYLLRHLRPTYPVRTSISPELELLGYDIDEINLERDLSPIPITLYWEFSNREKSNLIYRDQSWHKDGWTYILVGSRLYQIGTVDNLLPNGGFEKNLSARVILPFGYHNTSDSANQNIDFLSKHHRLESVPRGKIKSQTAVIVSPTVSINGITTVQDVVVNPGSLYVLGGWIKVTDSGRGFLGGVWRDLDKSDILYWYPAEDLTLQPWRYASGATFAPSSARYFTLLALNLGLDEVYFDDLIFFSIPIPNLFDKPTYDN